MESKTLNVEVVPALQKDEAVDSNSETKKPTIVDIVAWCFIGVVVTVALCLFLSVAWYAITHFVNFMDWPKWFSFLFSFVGLGFFWAILHVNINK